MTDYAALWIPNSNYFSDREGHSAQYIIIHATAGGTSAQGIAAYFQSTQNGSNPVSSHYIIDQKATVVQCVAEQDGAWANGFLSAGHDPWWNAATNPNDLTTTIELVKSSTDNSDPPTPAQHATLIKLVADICHRSGIPARTADATGGITGHFSIDPVNRSQCPGTFDWPSFWKDLQIAMNVPLGWTDDGATLIAPNGVPVVLGFRGYILNYPSWNPNNVPLMPERHTSQVLLHNLSCGSGQIQPFLYSYLWYTPSQGVVNEVQLGSEIASLRAKLNL
jgi:N-acetyl-anhydromuramyl-L-alanine amidase AmpD